jgi:hypothetical protein
MGDVVDIEPVRLEENQELIADCCRYQEGILSEANMRRKYGFTNSVWEKLADNSALLSAVEDEKIRRMRSGQQKREKAQLLVVRAPDILDGIMSNPDVSPRHRIDAIKTLDDFSATGPASAPAADRFIITINLNGDVEHYNKAINVTPNDPNDISYNSASTTPDININTDSAPQTAAITAPATASKTPEELALDALMARGD